MMGLAVPLQTAPGEVTNGQPAGNRQPQKVNMYTSGHKVQRNVLAGHRAALLFSPHRARQGDPLESGATIPESPEPPAARLSHSDVVRRGLLGFVSTRGPSGA
jgi:hypothetical protein